MSTMAPSDRESPGTFEHMLDVEVADFRERYQRYVLVLVGVLAWLAALRSAILYSRQDIDRSNLPAVVCLVVTLLLAYLLRRHTVLSLALSLLGLGTAVSAEAWQHPGSPAVFCLGAVIVLISAVASTTVLLTSVVLAMAAVVLATAPLPEPGALLLPAGLALACTSVMAWIASRPIFDSLEMALYSARDALRVRDELREQRRHLAQSVKALDEALYRLGRLNTSLVIARQQAEEARQLKVHFANMISHEIRTPLNIIISFSEVIANAPESYGMSQWPASLREDVNEIYRAGRHLLSLINDVLDLAQIEANRVVLKKERGQLTEVVEQAVTMARKWFDHAGLYLCVETSGDIPDLQIDRVRIRQVILNLLSNARHYTARGGVTVRIERAPDEVIVSVKDTGVGIAPETLQHLFDEFQQPGESLDNTVGSGLGLSISRMFIGLHGGRMWADSAGVPGLGATVSFSLPLQPSNTAVELPPSPRDVEFWQSRYDRARAERVILVAANDTTVLQLGGRLLGTQGRVITGSLAIVPQLIQEHQPDALVTFPASEQEKVFVQDLLRQEGCNVPVVTCLLDPRSNLPAERRRDEPAATPSATAPPVAPPTADDVNLWLVKPVTREELIAAVRSVAPKARTVLSVEDDLSMARFYEISLASDGHLPVTPAITNLTRVAEVMPALEQGLPDVILLDLNLADGSGWDALAELRARWSRDQLPVIVVTAMDRYGLPVLRAREFHVQRAETFSQRETVLCLQNVLEAALG
jgi:signal transduction histidine kinase/CheY-like chemotaxis protein